MCDYIFFLHHGIYLIYLIVRLLKGAGVVLRDVGKSRNSVKRSGFWEKMYFAGMELTNLCQFQSKDVFTKLSSGPSCPT